MKQAENLKT